MSKMYQWLSIVTCLLSEDLFFLGKVKFQLFKDGAQGHSLMVQWWGLGTSTDGSWVQTLTGELRSCKSHCAAKKKEEGRKEHNFRRECSFQFKRIWRMRQKFMKHVRGAFTPNHPRAGSPHPALTAVPRVRWRDGLPPCPSAPEHVGWILFCRNRV